MASTTGEIEWNPNLTLRRQDFFGKAAPAFFAALPTDQ